MSRNLRKDFYRLTILPTNVDPLYFNQQSKKRINKNI